MIPRRGLRPANVAHLASRRPSYYSSNASRQFSSLPRNSSISAVARRTSPLQSAPRRVGTSDSSNLFLNASAVRYGSWYAPWTWGRSSTPQSDAVTSAPAVTANAPQTPVTQQVVTSATPELAPAGIDKAAVLSNTTEASTAAAQPVSGSVEGLVETILNDENALQKIVTDPAAAIQHFGALKEMGLDYGWGPTAFFEWTIEHIYLMSGYGWGASIIIATLLIRIGLLRFQFKASDNMAKMAAVTPLVKDLHKEMTEAMKSGDEAKSRVAKSKQAAIYKEVGTNPIASMLPAVWQGVLGYGAFRCLRGMSSLPVPGLDQGGFAWFNNLTIPDPFYVLPALSGGIMYLLMKAGGETGASNQTMSPGAMTAMQLGFPAIMTLVSIFQPAGVQLYLICTAIFGGVTTFILRKPGFREWWGMAPLPTKEAQEMWAKVAKGEIPLSEVITKDGKMKAFAPKEAPVIQQTIKYQPPTTTGKGSRRALPTKQRLPQHRGLTVKSISSIPAHLATPSALANVDPEVADRDHDFDTPPTGFFNKVDWFARNYRPKYLFMGLKLWMARTLGGEDVRAQLLGKKKDVAKMKAEEYEFRRKERFRNN